MSNDNSTKSNIRKVITIAVFVLLLIGAVYFYFSAPDKTDNSSTSDSISSVTSTVENTENSTASETQSIQSTQSTQSAEEQSSQVSEQSKPQSTQSEPQTVSLRFRNKSLLNQHYQKHGIDMGFASAEEYEKAAAAVPTNPAALHKTEKEDGDDVYYIESTNEFVVVSTDGYIRTYFLPDAGRNYFDRQ
ncbi:MAG: hypothetical protein ACI4JS_00495 [Oscillospiraceae bacterium]